VKKHFWCERLGNSLRS